MQKLTLSFSTECLKVSLISWPLGCCDMHCIKQECHIIKRTSLLLTKTKIYSFLCQFMFQPQYLELNKIQNYFFLSCGQVLGSFLPKMLHSCLSFHFAYFAFRSFLAKLCQIVNFVQHQLQNAMLDLPFISFCISHICFNFPWCKTWKETFCLVCEQIKLFFFKYLQSKSQNNILQIHSLTDCLSMKEWIITKTWHC